ncbi:hypothetical protein N9F08_01120 [bacterium]|nr:hypothetical protein [bacterium]
MKIIAAFYSFLFLAAFNLAFSQQPQNDAIQKRKSSHIGYGKTKRKNPEVFQGNRKKKKYFEGWYFKMVSADDSSIISVIPGISISEEGKEHAFIQLINGKTAKTSYFSYPIEAFTFSKDRFAVQLANNFFSEDSIILNIQNDSTSIEGKVYMTNQTKLTRKNKGKKKLAIMGWYRFVPFMQCYHGVVSLNHNLSGSLKMNQETHNFDKGLGYIEKDWGKSMPSSWIWMQSNSFNTEKTSFMLSVANIPWLGKSFTGFLGFYYHDGVAHRFGTYSHAKLQLNPSNSDTLKITISEKEYTYEIETYRSKSGILKAPVKGSMDRRIAESIDAKMKIRVLDKDGNLIFEDNTSISGLEIVGEMEELRKSLQKKQ